MKHASTFILPPGKSEFVICDDSLAVSSARGHSNAPFALDGKKNTPGEWMEISPKQGKLAAENPGERPIRIRIEFVASEVPEKTVTLDQELQKDSTGGTSPEKPQEPKRERKRPDSARPQASEETPPA